MTLLSDLILHVKSLVPRSDCNFLIDNFHEPGRYKEASIDLSDENHKYSTMDVCTINKNTQIFDIAKKYTGIAVSEYYNYIKNKNQFDSKRILDNFCYAQRFRMLRYSRGQSIHLHTDSDFFSTFGSCSLVLNDDYDGGVFKFFNDEFSINTNVGDALIFPADMFFTHSVSEVTSGVRYSINSFLCNKNYFIHTNSVRDSEYYYIL